MGMAGGDRLKGDLQVGEGLDAVHLASGDERGDPGPVLRALVVASEESVRRGNGPPDRFLILLTPIQSQGPDLVFDKVAVHLDPAVPGEEDQSGPSGQDVGDGLTHLGLARHSCSLGAEPDLEIVEEGYGPILAACTSRLRIQTTDLLLDPVERGDALETFLRDRRSRLGRRLDDLTPSMSPAVGQPEGAAVFTPIIGQPIVAGIAVDLENALEPFQHPFRVGTAPSWGIGEDHAGWIFSTPWPVIPKHRPEIAGLRPAATGVEHGSGGLVHKELAGSLHQFRHPVHDRGEMEARATDPVRQCRTVDGEPMPGHDLSLAV